MSRLIFSAHKIIDQNDFKIAEDNAASGRQICEHFQKTVAETLNKQMDHLKPGAATDGSKALEISAIMTVDPGQKVSMLQFGKGLSGSLIKIFGQDQFLSCIIRDRTSVDKKTKGLEGICVVLPMEKRRISTDAYLDKRDKSKISQHYQVIIEQDLKRIFPEIVTAAEERVTDPTSLGYQEALHIIALRLKQLSVFLICKYLTTVLVLEHIIAMCPYALSDKSRIPVIRLCIRKLQ